MLSYLDDNSIAIDVMKTIIGMCESFVIKNMSKVYLNLLKLSKIKHQSGSTISLKEFSIASCTNAYSVCLSISKKKDLINSYLHSFTMVVPEKEEIIRDVIYQIFSK